MTFWKILFRLFLALVVGALAGALFGQVLPQSVAWAVGVVVGVAEFVGGMVSGKGDGAGSSVRLMLRLGAVLLSWPVASLALTYVVSDRGVRIGLAAGIAAMVGMGAAKNGYGQDSARLIAVIIAVAIPAYAALAAVAGGDGRAMIAACVACAVAPVTAAVAWVWPDGHHWRLLAASGVCVAAGALVLVRTVVGGG